MFFTSTAATTAISSPSAAASTHQPYSPVTRRSSVYRGSSSTCCGAISKRKDAAYWSWRWKRTPGTCLWLVHGPDVFILSQAPSKHHWTSNFPATNEKMSGELSTWMMHILAKPFAPHIDWVTITMRSRVLARTQKNILTLRGIVHYFLFCWRIGIYFIAPFRRKLQRPNLFTGFEIASFTVWTKITGSKNDRKPHNVPIIFFRLFPPYPLGGGVWGSQNITQKDASMTYGQFWGLFCNEKSQTGHPEDPFDLLFWSFELLFAEIFSSQVAKRPWRLNLPIFIFVVTPVLPPYVFRHQVEQSKILETIWTAFFCQPWESGSRVCVVINCYSCSLPKLLWSCWSEENLAGFFLVILAFFL